MWCPSHDKAAKVLESTGIPLKGAEVTRAEILHDMMQAIGTHAFTFLRIAVLFHEVVVECHLQCHALQVWVAALKCCHPCPDRCQNWIDHHPYTCKYAQGMSTWTAPKPKNKKKQKIALDGIHAAVRAFCQHCYDHNISPLCYARQVNHAHDMIWIWLVCWRSTISLVASWNCWMRQGWAALHDMILIICRRSTINLRYKHETVDCAKNTGCITWHHLNGNPVSARIYNIGCISKSNVPVIPSITTILSRYKCSSLQWQRSDEQ